MRHIIIGAAGGIGAALSRRLAAQGDELLLCGRTEAILRLLADELGAAHQVLDARDFDAVDGAATAFGNVDGIVNCAGSLLLKPAHLTSEREWRDTLETNLTTAFAAVRAGARAMISRGGSIVLCGTATARTGFPSHDAIAAAKGGVIGLTVAAAASYAGRNIRVNCVAPGLVDTPLTARITQNEAARKASEGMHALGRLGRPDDVASAIAWLLDPANGWVTGQTIGVDGGLGTVRPR